jgi:hypothetical protein
MAIVGVFGVSFRKRFCHNKHLKGQFHYKIRLGRSLVIMTSLIWTDFKHRENGQVKMSSSNNLLEHTSNLTQCVEGDNKTAANS